MPETDRMSGSGGSNNRDAVFCNEMLHGLVRVAADDTAIAPGRLPDLLLAARCTRGDRVLLTQAIWE